jgi:hypothetical protein
MRSQAELGVADMGFKGHYRLANPKIADKRGLFLQLLPTFWRNNQQV